MNTDEGPFPAATIPPAAAAGWREAVAFLVGRLVAEGSVPPDAAADLVAGVERRQRLGSTAIGNGVAIPHVESPAVPHVVGVVGVSDAPIPWPDAIDGQPVLRVCLVVIPTGAVGLDLAALERVVRTLRTAPA